MFLMAELFKRRLAIVLAVALAALVPGLVACQADRRAPLSLKNAGNIAADFDRSFQPPPRTVNAILSKLHIPKNYSGADKFATCSDETGLSDKMLTEKMGKLPNYDPDEWPNRSGAAQESALIQFRQGNFTRAVKYLKWVIADITDDHLGALAGRQALFAVYHVFARNFDAADDAMSRASSYYASSTILNSGRRDWIAHTTFDLERAEAAIAQSKGDLIGSEVLYRKALKTVENGGLADPWYRERHRYARAELANVLMRQGRLLEAEAVTRDLLKWKFGAQDWEMAANFVLLGKIMFEQGRFRDAQALVRGAVYIYKYLCASSESLGFADAHDLLGKSLVAQGKWRQALDVYAAIRADMKDDVDTFQTRFAGNVDWAIALLRSGQVEDAAEKLQLAFRQTLSRFGADHTLTAEIRGILAMVYLAKGKRQKALAEFAVATSILLARSREPHDDGSAFVASNWRLNFILGAYMDLLVKVKDTELSRRAGLDAVAEAFRLAEFARGSLVQQALIASGARATLRNPALSQLARQEQDAQKQIAVIYRLLSNNPSPKAAIELRSRLKRLRSARMVLTAEIERRFPAYADLVNPKPATIKDARAALRAGETLIATYVSPQRTYLWAVPKLGKPAFTVVELGRRDLTKKIAHLRRALEPNAQTFDDIPAFDVKAAYQLYRQLLEPIEEVWKQSDSLLVIGHGPLGYLPLSLLPTRMSTLPAETAPLFSRYRKVPWLARSHAVTNLPSVAALRTLRGLPPAAKNRTAFVGFGDPLFNAKQVQTTPKNPISPAAMQQRMVQLRATPKTRAVDSAELSRLPRLPNTADELRNIALALGADSARDVFTGIAANEQRVKTMNLSAVRILAFATHGLVPGDLNGLLQPALALSAPDLAKVPGDGLLTMEEILGLKLDADWVLLSACNTAAADGAGAEAVSGLGRAFFYAGARGLLVSNWPVETTSATALTTRLFKRKADHGKLDRAQALRQAMLQLIDVEGFRERRGVNQRGVAVAKKVAEETRSKKGPLVFSYAHPIFWAPFTLVGDPGGTTRSIN